MLDLERSSALGLAAAIRRGEVSPTEVMDATLATIADRNPLHVRLTGRDHGARRPAARGRRVPPVRTQEHARARHRQRNPERPVRHHPQPPGPGPDVRRFVRRRVGCGGRRHVHQRLASDGGGSIRIPATACWNAPVLERPFLDEVGAPAACASPWSSRRRSASTSTRSAPQPNNQAISLPVHQAGDTGLPVGAQLVAGPWQESALLCVAAQVEQLLPWADRRPAPLP